MHGCERAAVEGQAVLQGEVGAGGGQSAAARMETFAEALNPVRLLKEGFDGVQRQHIIGSTTACVASYLPLPSEQQGPAQGPGRRDSKAGANVLAGTMQIANLGDSGCMVIRKGRVVLRTVEQTHAFNFPRQLGTGSQDTPADADRLSIPLLAGDIIVLGTDGLFDNMFDDEILQLVQDRCGDGAEGQSAAFPSQVDPAQAKDFAGVARCVSCLEPAQAHCLTVAILRPTCPLLKPYHAPTATDTNACFAGVLCPGLPLLCMVLLGSTSSSLHNSDLAIAAYGRACDKTRISPFVRRGVEAGCIDGAAVAKGNNCGGKLDDISCVLCRCDVANNVDQNSGATSSGAGEGRGRGGLGTSGTSNTGSADGTGTPEAAGPTGA